MVEVGSSSAPPAWRHGLGDIRVALGAARATLRAQIGSLRAAVPRMLGAGAIAVAEAFATAVTVDRFGGVAGWSAPEVLVLLGLGELALGLAMLIGDGIEPPAFSLLVRDGTFDQMLTRPVSPLLWTLGAGVQVKEVGRAAAGLCVLVWALAVSPATLSAAVLGALVLATVSTTVVMVGILVVGAAVTIRTIEGPEFVNAFTYGGAYFAGNPLEIYGAGLRALFLLVVPLATTVYVPTLVVLDREGPGFVGPGLLPLVPVAAAAFAGASALAWRRAVRFYVGSGS